MKTKNKKEKANSLNADSTQNHIFELIRSAQNGNEDVFSELKKRYEPLIENAVLKNTVFGMTSQDIEDLRQEALVQFYNAVLNFD